MKIPDELNTAGHANVLEIRLGEVARTEQQFLAARYRDQLYTCKGIMGGKGKQEYAAIFQFHSRTQRPDIPNTILLMTIFKGKYRATGAGSFSEESSDGYLMGDDLEIKVSEPAEEVIQRLKHGLDE